MGKAVGATAEQGGWGCFALAACGEALVVLGPVCTCLLKLKCLSRGGCCQVPTSLSQVFLGGGDLQ